MLLISVPDYENFRLQKVEKVEEMSSVLLQNMLGVKKEKKKNVEQS